MARRSSRPRGRKRRRSRDGGGATAPARSARGSQPNGGAAKADSSTSGSGDRPPDGAYSRSEQRNAAVQESLEPLREGERPAAVTVAAIVAFVLAAGNLVAYLAGLEIDGDRPSPLSLVFPALLLVAAWGMWRARYWAVLGMQAVLAIVLVGFSLLLLTRLATGDLVRAGISLLVVAAAGTLFWFMVRAMARIQMPERR